MPCFSVTMPPIQCSSERGGVSTAPTSQNHRGSYKLALLLLLDCCWLYGVLIPQQGSFLHPSSLAPGSDRDLRLLREHRETLALDSGTPARLVSLPLINYLVLTANETAMTVPKKYRPFLFPSIPCALRESPLALLLDGPVLSIFHIVVGSGRARRNPLTSNLSKIQIFI